jgi:peptidoglycan glycosyltransferase
MTDLLERLAAANPVPEPEKPPIQDLWRKVAELQADPRRGQGMHRPRSGARIGRAVSVAIAVVIPIIVVAAIAVPLLGAHHTISHPAATTPSHGELTLNPAAQRVAARRLGGRVGAIVAVDPRTGAIRVMYGNSTRGDRDPAAAAGAAAALGATARDESSPGAAFEIVTTAAALDSGRYTPGSLIIGRSPLTVSGVSIRNDLNESFGQISLTRALSYSVNTVFAQVGAAVGPMQMTAAMRRLGFYSSPQLGSAGRASASGMRVAGRFVLPGTVGTSLGRVAIGQGGLTATPLQMAMVASAVADGGTLMTPRLQASAPSTDVRAMTSSTARAVAQMLRQVVEHGTATPADLKGMQIAGKTATTEAAGPGSGRHDLWFVGFAPTDHPKIAIAVVIKDVKGGFGGTDAAPLASAVIQKLLASRQP